MRRRRHDHRRLGQSALRVIVRMRPDQHDGAHTRGGDRPGALLVERSGGADRGRPEREYDRGRARVEKA